MAQSTSTEQPKSEGMGWRVSASIVTVFGFLISIILWFFFYAVRFNVYQNIAIVVVMVLAFVAIMGATWASWGIKQGLGQRKRDETM
jgi:membrane protein YdbS with pleckstrin-like domain